MWKLGNYPANWPQRQQHILECLTTFIPDILCVQELHSLFHDVIIKVLPSHEYVKDHFGEFGFSDIGMMESLRRLFWILLKIKTSEETMEENKQLNTTSTRKILVTTTHFTWEGHTEEFKTNVNLRKQQAQIVLFMGDSNESFHPRLILYEAGFMNCFSTSRLPLLSTHPQRPSLPSKDILCDSTLDWIMHNNYACPILANVLRNLLCAGGYSVSDHCPVMCIYEIGCGPYTFNGVTKFSDTYIV
ncbi:unnamed protein product [Rotaria magnacalcarata]|nr:unnamed protein product [Rotaria magnacalcarata]CAF4169860.1 unnamed protein product [Rotaria magnacalcarata]CAF4187386.1 unnamed protein product [Rotaria magnacalcarata]